MSSLISIRISIVSINQKLRDFYAQSKMPKLNLITNYPTSKRKRIVAYKEEGKREKIPA
jgi:hypothetical protein